MIDINDLSVQLGPTKAVDLITAEFKAGQVHALIGPNGAGKTSLLKALCGLLQPSGGAVNIDGRNVKTFSMAERARIIGYLPQERTIAWDLKAIDIAALGAHSLAATEAKVRAMAALEIMGLRDHADTPVFSLSGGQRARVLLARLLATTATVYCLDEPLSALDPAWQRRVLQVLKARAAQGCTVIVSLHDIALAAQFADQLWVLDRGRLVAHGAPEQALTGDVLSKVFNITGAFEGTDTARHLRLDAQALPENHS